ncbi:hypothetical protein ABFS82_13G114200 [Erythranthe guttata]|uniref:F-box protein At1g61340-like n=1 Tax=Erythranthe guttata TaxID=4155 RepID=UPI00064E12EB|nr:PREDICTED: F-box protein At1g61340-like [Erythranthe guttata]|eukprot:XP_012849401.1 PREDICTED: F-box protein At1g61340-like [Erythranthe guttata]
MAIGKKCGSNVTRADEGYGMGLVRSTSFGRKRVSLSNLSIDYENDDNCMAATTPSPSKRRCFEDSFFCAEKASLEDLPQEILIRILCGVEHDDLKTLFFVSKAIREATLVAKQSHFAFNTPSKTVGFQSVDHFCEFDEIEAPNAPKQSRVLRSRLTAKKLSDISVALFASSGDEESCWPRRDLFLDMEE